MAIRVLGVMTGTSCDGLDASCVNFSRAGMRLAWSASIAYPDKLRRRVFEFQLPGASFPLRACLELHRDLGEWYAKSLIKLLKGRSSQPDAIANHGQTVAHFPADRRKKGGMTLQLGEAALIAAATGITTLCGFRAGDLAAGGQGAPLVPIYHQLLAKLWAKHPGSEPCGIAIHNLGGVSNLTYFGPKNLLLAFDTGPAGLWIDAAASLASGGRLHFDHNGSLARRGSSSSDAVKKLITHPFFNKMPPKSTGRDDFPFGLFMAAARGVSGPSLVATATEAVAETIALSYKKWILSRRLPLDSIYFCGGGARNSFLLSEIRARLASSGVRVFSTEDRGVDPQMIEAQAFAYLGYLSLMGKPLGGAWTGARGFAPPAQIVPGKNWRKILKKIQEL